MTKRCLICDKGSLMGGGYSNRTRATKFNPTGARRRYPNLQWTKTNSGFRIRACTRCIKANKQLAI